ncbi:MAG: DUF2809 domain-containing protein [Jaaginema sp. PMC 1079.18]|nr:DUF2809 domain-containing protein [Jaaginema sp. PMC 1080.18]MEC4854019.1 DUF2809 domain-containing protein [Jaaginema sp. PMC 1079.18]MEC4868044.1 DUF2809 domain-containing protein [Jaaginema sp. PMC 1078.18]
MKRDRLLALISLIIITPIGFWTKFYQGIGHTWFNNYGGAILYEIFWCLFFFLLRPKRETLWQAPLFVFLLTCFLELLQLWQNPTLVTIRSTFLGRMLLGTTFVPWDFFYYLVGCILGGLWLRFIWNLTPTQK